MDTGTRMLGELRIANRREAVAGGLGKQRTIEELDLGLYYYFQSEIISYMSKS